VIANAQTTNALMMSAAMNSSPILANAIAALEPL